jgi:lipopolysaccharide export LptBFGC system permease protein LptF
LTVTSSAKFSRHAFLGLIVFTFVLFVPQLVRLMELLVRHSGSGAQIARLFLYIVPGVLIFTIPMAVLVGVLLGLGRMSADSEIIALTALGISRQRMLVPVAVLALTGGVATATLTLWLGPAAFRSLRNIEADLLASQASFQVQPRCSTSDSPRWCFTSTTFPRAGRSGTACSSRRWAKKVAHS